MPYQRLIAILYILSQLLLVFVPAHADCSDVRCVVVIDDCDKVQGTLGNAIVVPPVRIYYRVSPQALFENWTSVSSNVLHIRPLVRPDKVPVFFASSLRYAFLRHSALLI